MDNQIIVGLDIGTTKIACFIGKRGDDGKLVILGHGKSDSDGVDHGIVLNIVTAAQSVKKAVEAAAERANIDVTEVYVGIAGQHIKSAQHQTEIIIPNEHPYILQEDLDQLIEQQGRMLLQPGEKIIHIIPQKYSIDNEDLSEAINPVGVRGKRLKGTFHVVTCNEENCKNIIYCVESAGYKVKNIVLEPIASAYAVLDNTEKEAGVALVDIGGGTTDIAIFQNNAIVHTAVIVTAGNKITTDIQQGCGILKRQAEILKIKYGCCIPAMVNHDDIISIPATRYQQKREISILTLSKIIEACTELILPMVEHEIEISCKNSNPQMAIVLTGGGSMLKGMKEICEMRLCKHSRIGTPDEYLDPTDQNLIKEISHPMYATGIGLVLYGLEEAETLSKKEEADEEPSTGTQTNENTTDGNNPINIFAGFNEENPNEETTKIDEQEEPKKRDKKENTKPKKSLSKAITDYFNRLLKDESESDSRG